MRIRALRIRDFKRASSIAIDDADRAIVVLGGENGAGKSSALDAIAAALTGGRAIPPEPIRRGADRAEIEVDLGEVVVTRTITSAGGSLTIRTADGMRPTKPQAWLDARLGDLSCDPVAFMRLPAGEQAARLRVIAGVDTTDLDARRAAIYADRTDCGRDGKRAAGLADSLPSYPAAPAEEVVVEDVIAEQISVADLAAQLDEAVRSEDAGRRAEAAVVAARARVREAALRVDMAAAEAASRIREAEAELARTRAAAATESRRLMAAAEQADAEAATVASDALAITGRVVISDPIRAALADAERANGAARAEAARMTSERRAEAARTNAQVRANLAHAQAAAEVAALRAAYAAHTAQIEAIDAERAAMLAAARFPVAGLGFDSAGGITYRGLPLEQASGAEQIRVAMAIALAGSPEIRVVLVRDASLLDDASMALVAELAEEAGAQVWLERVGAADEGAVVIVDGGVAP